MASITITGNLTKDAQLKTGKNDQPYVILRIAENIPKPSKGKILKENANQQFDQETFFHSVFVNEPQMIDITKDLKKGQAIKVTGRANVSTEKDNSGFDQNVLKSIKASSINLEPFKGRTIKEQPKPSN